jgi:GH15 family glucan-1,4-alpha-glucosidase
MEVYRSCTPFTVVNLSGSLLRPFNASDLTGGKDLEEIELTHLDGHKGSKPVRIGNGAADHVQLVGSRAFLSAFPSINPPHRISTASCMSSSIYI